MHTDVQQPDPQLDASRSQVVNLTINIKYLQLCKQAFQETLACTAMPKQTTYVKWKIADAHLFYFNCSLNIITTDIFF